MDSPDPWADFYNEFQQFSQQHTALHVQTFQPSKRSLAYDTLHNQSEKEQPNINEVEDTTVWVLSSVEASDLEDTEDKEDSDNFSPVKSPGKKCRVYKEGVGLREEGVRRGCSIVLLHGQVAIATQRQNPNES